ncbi:YceI family protein [Luteimonas sp. MJ246]|uniref:YceI family protein n=1 Tax=Luteimonas sp. MJ174 TaxID=3129237 RepID=UPI0031BA4163
MRASRQRPGLRSAALAALCALAAACAQAPPRDVPPAATQAPAGQPHGAGQAGRPAAPPPHPEAVSYALDPVHTRIAIAIDHAGFSRAIATVSGTTGTLQLAPGSWEGARVDVEIPLDRLDFGDAAWNRAVAARGLLDTGQHPVATFHSTRVEPVDAGRARIHGLLTLRGNTREVVLDAVRNAERRYPLPPFRRAVGFSATATLSRADFGSTAWDSMVGDAVEVRIELEASR